MSYSKVLIHDDNITFCFMYIFSTQSKNVNSLVVEENVLQISLSFDINLEALSNEITFFDLQGGPHEIKKCLITFLFARLLEYNCLNVTARPVFKTLNVSSMFDKSVHGHKKHEEREKRAMSLCSNPADKFYYDITANVFTIKTIFPHIALFLMLFPFSLTLFLSLSLSRSVGLLILQSIKSTLLYSIFMF